MIEEIGKKSVLRFSATQLDLQGLNSAPTESTMAAIPTDFYVENCGEGLYEITFRTKKIDKKELANIIEGILLDNPKKKKRQAKKEALARLLSYAPIMYSDAKFLVEEGYVYIFGKHKKVLETLFSGSCCVPDPFEDLTKLWDKADKPCDNVTVSDGEWTRVFKKDGKDAASNAIVEGGKVIKFTDVISYSLCLGHLVVNTEFSNLDSVNQVFDEAEQVLIQGGL